MTLITSRDQLLAEIRPAARLQLADGDYGALNLSRLADVAIEGGPGAVFSGVSVSDCDDLIMVGLAVDWTPQGAKADAKANAFRLAFSKRVRVEGLRMRGRPVPADAPGALDPTADPPPPMNAYVAGYYAGRALPVEFCEDVDLLGLDISGFFQGVSFGGSKRVRLLDGHIHRLRTTPVKGGGTDIQIGRMLLEHMTPWRYFDPVKGKMAGDHFDFVHLYTGAGKPIAGLKVFENLLDAAGGENAIGIFLQDDHAAGILAPEVVDNIILTGRNEGVALSSGVTDAVVDGNVLLGPPGTLKPPTFVPRTATLASVKRNTWAENSTRPRHSVTFPDNTYLPRTAASAEAVAAARAGWLAKHQPPDPREARIADLEAQLEAAQASVAGVTGRLAEVLAERDALALRLEAVRAALA